MSYPLGWPLVPQVLVRRERWSGGYKVKCIPLVFAGQDLLPDQPVIRLEREKVGATLQSISRLSLPSVTTKTDLKAASMAGPDIETLPAGLHGRVVDITRRGGVVIESRACVLHGAIGAGNQVAGVLTIWRPVGIGHAPQIIPPGAILIVPGPLNLALLRQIVNSEVNGVIASSMSLRDLEGFLRTDLLQLINSTDIEPLQKHLPSITLLFTEGLNASAMPARIVNVLSRYQGSIALLSGATRVRRRIFPELVISLPANETTQNWHPLEVDLALVPGAHVRVCTGEHEGAIGVIDYIFVYQQVFTSGVRARAVRLRLEDGSLLVVPLMQIARIE